MDRIKGEIDNLIRTIRNPDNSIRTVRNPDKSKA